MPRRAAYTLAIVVVGGLLSCGGSQTPEDSDQEVIGKPPSETDDPFEIMRMPDDARRAGSSGYIGPDEETDGDGEETEVVRASEAEPPDEADEVREPTSEEGVRCFSCVRICPLAEGSSAECGGEERDVICGWGVHGDRASARQLATAECDGALDMARRMRTWSRIEGECPEPSCR